MLEGSPRVSAQAYPGISGSVRQNSYSPSGAGDTIYWWGVKTRVTGLVVAKGETKITADAYVCACDVPGIQRMLPTQAWRKWPEFDNYKLDAVPVATVQLRFDGWVTELQNATERQQLNHAAGIDNLLYS